MNRIRRILRQPEEPRAAAGLVLLPGLLLGVFCVVAAAQQASSTGESAPADDGQRQESPHQKWVDNDVVYIIADEERDAFEGLGTDEESDRFIEQFWARRDPTPGTPANEFKDEHYRRIAYANDRFASEAPGWKSDRGRVYIVYGPPDEIESHPSGGTFQRLTGGRRFSSTAPFEFWRYRRIEGIGNDVWAEFVDTQRSGEFRLVGGLSPVEPEEK